MDVMGLLFLLGRILYGGLLAFMSANHFMNLQQLAGYAESKGVPSAQIAVIVSGLSLLLGALSILLGVYTQIGVLLLAIFFVPVNFMMHRFWAIEDPNMKMAEMSNFLKNTVILGAGLMFLALSTPWAYALNIGMGG